jgi:SPASM domain peptide maturase of grasp-with-spasm system
MERTFIIFFENCIVTKGAKRCLVSDIHRSVSELMPLDFYFFYKKIKNKKSISEIYNQYGIINKDTVTEYINHIVKNEWGFYASKDELNLFPKISTKFNQPSLITNAILEFNEFNEKDLGKKIIQLETLSCKDIVIIFKDSIDLTKLEKINVLMENTRIKSLELYIPYSVINENIILDVKVDVLTKIIVYGSKIDKICPYNKNHFYDLIYTNKEMKDFKFCGVVDLEYFNTNDLKIYESLNHNSCLHKKISIDKDGYIRNCPSMPQHFGNIKDTTLEEALNHPDFKKYWNVTKDVIAVCKDCEFRHICTDCRAYTERTHFEKEIDLSKPLKCGYNPYTNEWAEWSTNPLKQKAIEYYGMQELVKKDA